MSTKKAPKKGTRAFWPRVRASRDTPRIRSWTSVKDTKPVGFLGYKAGMVHVIATDNRPKSLSNGEDIALSATIIECPPLMVAGAVFYKNSSYGLKKVSTVLHEKFEKEWVRKASLPKKVKTFNDVPDFDDLRLLVYTQPKLTGMGSKKPQISELGIGGSKDNKLVYVKEKIGKSIQVSEVFSSGNLLDVHGLSKGKGFQGPVKRFGVELRSHKSEKSRRNVVRGPWTGPKMWTAPHSGKTGYHLRTEYNKWVLQLGGDPKSINVKEGFHHFGVLKNPYLLVKGSVIGPKKHVLTLLHASRPAKKFPREAPVIRQIVR